MFRVALAFMMALTMTGPVWADAVYLKNGSKVEGKVLEESDYAVKIEINGVPRMFYLHMVDRIERDSDVQSAEEPPVNFDPEDITDAQRKLVRRLLEANGAGESMNRIFEQIIAQAPEGARPELRQRLNTDELIGELVPIYLKYFTELEIQQLIRFYKSPVGQKNLKLTPTLMEEAMRKAAEYFHRQVAVEEQPATP